MRRAAPATSAPTPAQLREAALSHLARYGGTATNLVRVLERRLARWSRAAAEPAPPELRQAVRQIVSELAQAGAVNDTAFAESRTRRLNAAGKSSRATAAHLAAKGVPAEIARQAASRSPEQELAAAALHLRRRRLGCYAAAQATAETRHRALANLARAGFAASTAAAALRLTKAEAESRIRAFRAAF